MHARAHTHTYTSPKYGFFSQNRYRYWNPAVFSGPGWKGKGYRLQGESVKDGEKQCSRDSEMKTQCQHQPTSLISRSGNDSTSYFPTVLT